MDSELTDIVWAAGFLDGEGCFGLYARSSGTKNRHPSARDVRVAVAQMRREPLEHLERMFGGRIRPVKVTSGKTAWQWNLDGAEKVRSALEILVPYLRLKKNEAQIVLDYAKTVKQRGRTPISDEEIAYRNSLIEAHRSAREWWRNEGVNG